MSENPTYDEFEVQVKEIIEISERLNDKWTLERVNDDPGGIFLRYKQMKTIQNKIFLIDYHILFSLSYSVPVMYFNVQDTDSGQLLTLEEFRKIFIEKNEISEDLNQVLTQMEHPLLFRPFLALHPCKTADLLAVNASSNKVLTFISIYGPFIFLNLDLEYGKFAKVTDS